MSKIGGLVLAMQSELECVMSDSFSFHPSELSMSRFEIAKKSLQSQGVDVTVDMLSDMWDNMNQQDNSPY